MKRKQNLNLETPLLRGDSHAVMPSLGHGTGLSYRERETPESVSIGGLGCSGKVGAVGVPALWTAMKRLTPSPLDLSLYNPEYLMSIFGVSERTEVATGSAPKVASCVKQKTQRFTDLTGDGYEKE
jgi:hypothetical protein